MWTVISVIFTWFLVSSYLLKLLVFLYFFWFDLIFIYIYLFTCAMKEWEDFRTIRTSTWEIPWCLTPLFSSTYFIWSPTIVVPLERFRSGPQKHMKTKKRKFAPNSSPIRIRILACTSVSIFSITLGLNVQSRWLKLGWKFNLKGYNFVVYQKPEFWS